MTCMISNYLRTGDVFAAAPICTIRIGEVSGTYGMAVLRWWGESTDIGLIFSVGEERTYYRNQYNITIKLLYVQDDIENELQRWQVCYTTEEPPTEPDEDALLPILIDNNTLIKNLQTSINGLGAQFAPLQNGINVLGADIDALSNLSASKLALLDARLTNTETSLTQKINTHFSNTNTFLSESVGGLIGDVWQHYNSVTAQLSGMSTTLGKKIDDIAFPDLTGWFNDIINRINALPGLVADKVIEDFWTYIESKLDED